MSDRVHFMRKALVQRCGLPPDAFEASVVRVAYLVDAPWDADLMDRDGDTDYRQATFGEGLGMPSFRVDDPAKLAVAFDIAGLGNRVHQVAAV